MAEVKKEAEPLTAARQGDDMNKKEALAMLAVAPRGRVPSRINPGITEAQFVEIIRKAILAGPDKVDGIYERRVYQAYKNQKRPRY